MPILGPLWFNTGGLSNPAQPQPPTANTAAPSFAKPEWVGQFGTFVYQTDFNATGIDFRMSNPGRSA